jgi:hypothetical protein
MSCLAMDDKHDQGKTRPASVTPAIGAWQSMGPF